MAKWDNMLAMLWMLRAGKKHTAAQIADNLEINVRTVYRYIDALCASGVPIVAESGHNGGIYILENFTETPLFFTSVELNALVDAFKFTQGAGYPYTQELESVLKKVENGLHDKQRSDLSRQRSGLDVMTPPRPPSLVARLRDLEQAGIDGQTLHISYRKAQTELKSEREIDPYGLVYDKHEWYAVAYCHIAQSVRTFRADRIEGIEKMESYFDRPEQFSAAAYFRDQSEREREAEGPVIVIHIEGESDVIDEICGHWHLRHYLTQRTDREAWFGLDVPTMNKHLPKYLMTFGSAVQIREPLALKHSIRERIAEIAKHYED